MCALEKSLVDRNYFRKKEEGGFIPCTKLYYISSILFPFFLLDRWFPDMKQATTEVDSAWLLMLVPRVVQCSSYNFLLKNFIKCILWTVYCALRISSRRGNNVTRVVELCNIHVPYQQVMLARIFAVVGRVGMRLPVPRALRRGARQCSSCSLRGNCTKLFSLDLSLLLRI